MKFHRLGDLRASFVPSVSCSCAPTEEVLIRWAQVGLLSGVMELGGNGVHEPWDISPSCLERYRKLARWRMELVPYLHHLAHEAHLTGTPLQRFGPGERDFRLGDAFFLAPVTDGERSRRVKLPPGRWREWFHPERAHEGQVSVRCDSLDEFPLFVREGAIVPLDAGDGALTLDLWPGEGESAVDFRWGDAPSPEPTRLTLRGDVVRFTGRPLPFRDVVVRVRGRAHQVREVTREGGRLASVVLR